jgi:DNA-binding NtrC family response regulator
LNDAEAALIGRAPDRARVDAIESSHLDNAQYVSIPSPNVSANHVWVHNSGGAATVVDLGSRNGTWLRLPPRCEVKLPLHDEPISLHIAPAQEVDAPDPVLADSNWTDAHDYPTALATSVSQWLDHCDLAAKVTVIPRSDARADGVGRIPLASGLDLVVEPVRTFGGGWLDALARVERYVVHQNVLFDTVQGMRDEGLVVASPAMREAVRRVVETAASGARVLLLTGASGTGKEGLARCFHRHTRRPGAFVARNCAVLSKDFVRSELFGAEKGAFTGSVQRIVGAVEAANEGTLFLDEFGELPREVQPMLLRFLDHGEYERLGRYGTSATADVKIVCATNRDLRAATLTDQFRMDLWFRLSVHVVEVPALRDRPEDIIAYLKSRMRPGGGSLFEGLAPETLGLLSEHDWPGNFRELVSFAERIHRIAPTGRISADAARRALAEGALHPLKPARAWVSNEPPTSLARQSEHAAAAFAEDRGVDGPRTWDQVKDFVENYLKPVMFAELSKSAQVARLDDVDLRIAAERLGSDRGTAVKQLRRYFDRFVGQD